MVHLLTPGKFAVLFVFLLLSQGTVAQVEQDSVRVLDEVTVEAYAADRKANEVAASIGVIQLTDLNRFSQASMLPAFNLLPGVRMEERSPGSYRFSIRGSLLRSPFGIRNVKFYWNGLPFTDGGGNTYLNLLDLYSVNKAEVIKGPAGSMYGAGTGGAVLMRSPDIQGSGLGLTAMYGSFGSLRYGAALEAHSESLDSRVQFVRQQSDGYRAQSAMKRNAFNADMVFTIDASSVINVTVLYSDLFYQTPGGLTELQYLSNPQQARPTSPAGPGAVEQKAAVYNQTLLSGVTFEHQWSKNWSTLVGLVGSDTDFRNPSIRNYETRKEQNFGARVSSRYQDSHLNLAFGGEYQHFNSPVTVTNNISGDPGTQVMSKDDITSNIVMGFGQLEADLGHGILFTTGLSLNYLEYLDNRLALSPPETNARKFNPVLLPRLALLKKVSSTLSVYASASKGYSPPSVAEVVPSTGIYNPTLNPETGWSYEAGFSGSLGSSFDFHLALYDFRLTNAIVLQRDSSGADYFVNAGETHQQGIELNATWTKHYTNWLKELRILTSLTYNHYRFGSYVNDGSDYSGNAVTGVPPLVVITGIDATLGQGWYLRVTGTFTDRIPLNDANSAHAADYFLLGARAGYRSVGRLPVDFFAGIDNALNQRYSLGNDLNAAGGRYYNAAPTVNYYVGVTSKIPFTR